MPPVLSTLRPHLHPSTHHAPDVRIKLTHANYFAWRIEVFEGLGSFGLSGEEIRLDKKYEFEELCRTTRYKVDMKDPDTGVVEQVEYEWDESAERSFLAKESRQQMQKDHKVDTDGKLWLWIALSIDTNILHTALGSAIESVVFHQDNKSAIWLTTEPTRYRRSRHILIKIAYIREHCILRVVLTSYLNTVDMTADMLTKPLQGAVFVKHTFT